MWVGHLSSGEAGHERTMPGPVSAVIAGHEGASHSSVRMAVGAGAKVHVFIPVTSLTAK